ncbi:hypothetical protein D3C72_1922500 [compost metagenome]
MRVIAEELKEEKIEEIDEIDPKNSKAIQAYEDNQTMMTSINAFRFGLKFSGIQDQKKNEEKSKVNKKEVERQKV